MSAKLRKTAPGPVRLFVDVSGGFERNPDGLPRAVAVFKSTADAEFDNPIIYVRADIVQAALERIASGDYCTPNCTAYLKALAALRKIAK